MNSEKYIKLGSSAGIYEPYKSLYYPVKII